MPNEYVPELLPDEIPANVLEKLPKEWKENADEYRVKHLIQWRHHLEGDYRAKSKNHAASMAEVDRLNGVIRLNIGGVPLAKASLPIAMEKLQNDNYLLLEAHDRLRDAERKLNHEIHLIQETAKLDSERFSSKFLAGIAIVVSLTGSAVQIYKSDQVEKTAGRIVERKLQKFYTTNYRSELARMFQDDLTVAYREIKEMNNEVLDLRRKTALDKVKISELEKKLGTNKNLKMKKSMGR